MSGSVIAEGGKSPKLLSAADLAEFPNQPADARIHYGDDPLQFGDLRIPDGEGPHPVMIYLHGGCWYAEYDIAHSSALTDAFTRNGIATWSLEYRRIGNDGGGWPGTFEDVSRGADHLREIAAAYDLDLDRVIVAGHSAGGQLAMWLAARAAQPADAPLRARDPLPVHGVLAMAPAADFDFLYEQGTCGDAVAKLMGGSPAEWPDRYRWADPVRFAPTAARQVIFVGRHDDTWTPAGKRYLGTATRRGDDVQLVEAPASGHFEMIDPRTSTWPLLLQTAQGLLPR